MKSRLLSGLLLSIILHWGGVVHAQKIMWMAGFTIGYAEILQLACNTNEFSATALTFTSSDWFKRKNRMSLTMSGDRIRTEFRQYEFAPPNTPETRLKELASLDTDEVVAIYHRGKARCVFLFPRKKASWQTTVSKEWQENHDELFKDKITRTVIGHETIKGYSCRKIWLNDGDTKSREATYVWENEKNNQPVSLLFKGTNVLVNLAIQSYEAGKPDADKFEIPAGYTNYTSLSNIVMDAENRVDLKH